MKESWREMILEEMVYHSDDWNNIVSTTLTDEHADIKFDASSGYSTEGCPFTVWTADRVYFPVGFDGAEWCESVARNPDGKPTEHLGSS